jgi:hypothetical protein
VKAFRYGFIRVNRVAVSRERAYYHAVVGDQVLQVFYFLPA